MSNFKIVGEGGNAVLQTIHASEGGRAIRLLQQRQKMQQHLQEAKEKLETKGTKRKNINWGGSAADRLEEQFKKETVGLVSAEDFKERRAKLEEQIRFEAKALFPQKFQERRKFELRLAKSKLSFGDEEVEEVQVPEGEGETDEENGGNSSSVEETKKNTSVKSAEAARMKLENAIKKEVTDVASPGDAGGRTPQVRIKVEEQSVSPSEGAATDAQSDDAGSQPVFKIRKRIGKDPTVDTSYLPDKERDARLAAERQRLVEEYRQKEEAEKRRPLCVTYSYWDGTGHRRRIQVLRGSTVGEFLELARKELEREFVELRCVAPENLMYVKEDLILPHNMTFFELIRSKARGKSGPLFHFDAHDDVRVFSDVRQEKEDSHAGKIVDKKWFERNKHIFPASRWEVFNPSKTYDTYTIYGDERMWKGVADHSNLVPW
ncbi:hypothetical protein ACSSS7_001289 [Eimeria intestinalis]